VKTAKKVTGGRGKAGSQRSFRKKKGYKTVTKNGKTRIKSLSDRARKEGQKE